VPTGRHVPWRLRRAKHRRALAPAVTPRTVVDEVQVIDRNAIDIWPNSHLIQWDLALDNIRTVGLDGDTSVAVVPIPELSPFVLGGIRPAAPGYGPRPIPALSGLALPLLAGLLMLIGWYGLHRRKRG